MKIYNDDFTEEPNSKKLMLVTDDLKVLVIDLQTLELRVACDLEKLISA